MSVFRDEYTYFEIQDTAQGFWDTYTVNADRGEILEIFERLLEKRKLLKEDDINYYKLRVVSKTVKFIVGDKI